jgi:hypothetical protein
MSIKSSPDRILDILEARFQPSQPSTVSRTAVNASASSVALVAANAGRVGLAIFNNGSTDLHLAYGTTAATTTSFSVRVSPGGFYEAPVGWAVLAVQGIWSGSPTGTAQITEVL